MIELAAVVKAYSEVIKYRLQKNRKNWFQIGDLTIDTNYFTVEKKGSLSNLL